MSGGQGGDDDRLSKDEFAELVQHLPFQEMFLIEYHTADSGWKQLFSRSGLNVSNKYKCHICTVDASSFKNLLSHINGRKHAQQMESVVNLYHPEYTHPKNKIPKKTAPIVTSNKQDGTPTNSEGTQGKTAAAPAAVVIAAKYQEKNVVTKPIKVKLTEKLRSKTDTTGKTPNLVKNPMAVRKSEPANKTANLVKNPIATTSIVIEDDTEEKPQYQTDRIIIPTVNNGKNSKDAKTSDTNETPMFSTKTYSSKPTDDDIHGILGVEYVIKLINKNKDCTPRYECGLCELVLDAYAMQRHLEGYNHRMKFCEKHFPTAIRHYRQYMQGIPEHELFKVMTPVLAKLAIAIEKHHGRNLPYECYESDFTLHRHDILAKAYSCRHASEQYGPNFTHVVDAKEIDKYFNERHNYAPPTHARSAIFDSKYGKGNDSGASSQLNGRNGPAIMSVPKDRHKNVVRDNNKTAAGNAPRGNVGLETFNTQFKNASNYMDFSMPLPGDSVKRMPANTVRSTPTFQPPNRMETFPPNTGGTNFNSNNNMRPFMSNSGYNYQAQQPPTNFTPFIEQVRSVDDQTYNNMVDEFLRGTLKGTHANASRKRSPHSSHSSHSSCPPSKRANLENDRLVELEIATLDAEYRKYRKDPETYPYYNDEWQKFWKRRKDELIAAGKDHRSYNYQPEWVKFIKDHIETAYRDKVETIKLKSQKHHGISLSKDSGHNLQNQGYNRTALNKPNDMDKKSKTEADHTQVVSVLRLMAALEENLGSLGPKIITLLSKALQLEKTNRGEIINSLLNDENCSVIETAKEKFKGLLLTGIVEGSKQRAMKQAVEEAESLLSSTQQLQANSRTTKFSSNISESQRKQQMQPIPTMADILRLLRTNSGQK